MAIKNFGILITFAGELCAAESYRFSNILHDYDEIMSFNEKTENLSVLSYSKDSDLVLSSPSIRIKFCKGDDKYLCFHIVGDLDSLWNFSVPRNDIKVGDTWSKNGKIYTVKKDMTDVGSLQYVIDASTLNKEYHYRYIFHSKKGLVGLGEVATQNNKYNFVSYFIGFDTKFGAKC